MTAAQPIGKKLDFIVQEMNREATTIGSKANDIEVAAHVVEMKSIIEKNPGTDSEYRISRTGEKLRKD